jgi:myo-inositol-1(or 4)-monophosphatase
VLNQDSPLVGITRLTPQQIEDTIVALYHAGDLLLKAQLQIAWKLKADGTFVTKLDFQVQDFLASQLAEILPGCAFIGEEDPTTWPLAADRRLRVILDPIDGTAAYVRGLNYFAISLAIVADSGQPLLAVIYVPALRKWCAASFDGDKPIRYAISVADGRPGIAILDEDGRGTDAVELRHSYIYVGSDAHRKLDMSRCQGKIRALGASAAHLALLMDNTPDPVAVIMSRYKIWDVAAGLALASAAGLDTIDLGTGNPYRFDEQFRETQGSRPVLLVSRPEVSRLIATSARVIE